MAEAEDSRTPEAPDGLVGTCCAPPPSTEPSAQHARSASPEKQPSLNVGPWLFQPSIVPVVNRRESVGVKHLSQALEDNRQLEAEQRRLQGLFQQAPGFVCFLRGREFVFDMANAAYFQLVGHRDIIGKSLRQALPEIEGQGYFELLDRVFTTGEPFTGRGMRVELQREPGAALSEAFVDFVYQPIRGADGNVSGIFVQGQEVTEAKRQEAQRLRAEEALRASEERYRTLFESIDDGFCLMQMILDERGETVDYRFLEANAAFEVQTGLKNAVGRTARELVPGLDASWFQLYGRVAATGESTHFENHAPAMGRWFDVYASRVGKPELRQVALVFKDISLRKQVEAERERLLERESAARAEAEEASRLKDEFLTTVSHELRTPLTAMLGWVQMLRAGSLPPDKRVRALETVERNARAQAQLIDDLLDVSRILSGKLRLEVAPVDVGPIVQEALDSVRPAADAKGVRIQAALDSTSTVMGDAQRLQQVVWNLLTNAVAFMTEPDAFVGFMVEAIEAETGIRPKLSTTGGTSDARFIKSYCPVVEFGLVGQTMHQVDERVSIADLDRLTAIYRGVLERYFAPRA